MSYKKAEELQLSRRSVSPVAPLSASPPWILPEATVNLTLMGKKKDLGFSFTSYTVQQYINNYYNYIQIYTDASENSVDKLGVAFIVLEI